MERGFGGGQPCGLAAALARGRRPPKAGGGPIKYHRLAFRNSLHQVGTSLKKDPPPPDTPAKAGSPSTFPPFPKSLLQTPAGTCLVRNFLYLCDAFLGG
jgi:hypothetical protein